MSRPANLIDTVQDFGSSGNIPLLITINANSFSNLLDNSGEKRYAIGHYVSSTAGIGVLQNANGQSSPPAGAQTIQGVLAPNLNVNTYNVTIKDIVYPAPASFIGNYSAPGRWKSTFQIWNYPTIFGAGTLPIYNASSQTTEEYYFLVFQKSVCIIEDVTSGTPVVANNQTKNINLNTTVRLSKASSRGKELNSSWIIQFKDNNGNFIPAVQGVDYSITFGNTGSDTIEIKVLQPKVFRIVCQTFGYNSNNHLFSGTGTGNITSNTDSSFYILNVAGVDEQDVITLPKINAVVTIQNQIGSLPIQSGYSGALITINGQIDVSSGLYIIKDLTSSTETIVTLTESEWLQELDTRANISLEIRRKTDNVLVITRQGIGPHTDITLPVGNFLIQFKTILK